MLSKATGREVAEKAGLEVRDPEAEASKRVLLQEEFEDYIADAQKRNALEAKEQAVLVAKEFLTAVKVEFADEVDRNKILEFDVSLRAAGRSKRTIANKRQRLQSMLRWAGIDAKVFPPKPKYDKKLPTIYSQIELGAMFGVADPYQRMVCNLALKLGLRDQEEQFAEFTDISWEESVYRVRSKPKFGFTVKDYEERDIPIPLDFLGELKEWKNEHPKQNLIVPTKSGRPNGKLLKMVKRLARRAGIECGWCPNCIAGVRGDRGCDQIELHKFRRTCITTWLRNHIDPRTVMEYAGHADLETTLRYARPAAAQERIAAVSDIKWY
jgi:integrase